MKNIKIIGATALALSLIGGVCASAHSDYRDHQWSGAYPTDITWWQTDSQFDGPNKDWNLSDQDCDFLKAAAQINLEEIQLSTTAGQNSQNADVKTYAAKMSDDHTKANDMLKRLAWNVGYTLPTTVSDKQQAEITRMSQLQSPYFDASYRDTMVWGHQDAYAIFQRESAQGMNPRVVRFATYNLHVLRDHLKMAQSLTVATTNMTAMNITTPTPGM